MVDDSLVWVDSSGLCVMTQGSQPRLISPELRELFLSRVQHAQLRWACAATNNQRRQYVVTLPFRESAPRIDRRVTAELRRSTADSGIETSSWRFGILGDPALTCIVEVDDEFGGPERLVGLDEYGFAWDLDQRDIAEIGELADFVARADSLHGVTITGSSVPTESASLFRGQTFSSGGIFSRVLALTPSAIMLDESVVSVSGSAAVGVMRHLWRSRWMDFDAPDKTKSIKRLDLYFSEDSQPGIVRVRVYTNRARPALLYENNRVESSGVALLRNISSSCWRHLQVVIDIPDPEIGDPSLHFEVTKLVFLVEDVDPA
jgi:hypothetical protein